MASSFDNRAITPIITSLTRLCMTKVALSLWQDFGQGLLVMAFDNIQRGGPMDYIEVFKDISSTTNRFFRAHKNLLLIPALLRKKVIEAVAGIEREASEWRCDHLYIPRIEDKNHLIYWRSEGTIDRIKTAQHLALDTDIDITTRFIVACNYCLVEGILTLWKQLEISGNSDHVNTGHCMLSFWVQRMRDGSDDPWPEAALEYLHSLRRGSFVKLACCRSIFPLLQAEDRERFLVFFQFATEDDILFSLYTMTKKEQHEVLSMCVMQVLCQYFKQQLRSFFLETTKKIWNYINETTFQLLLDFILFRKISMTYFKDWDDSIVEDLWNLGPDNFKAKARENAFVRKSIDLFFKEKEKRKAEDEMKEQMKKKFRSDA